ncbi:MAG: ABC transporter substrate-binding protein, partial [Pleurocapsa sp.]
MAISLFRPAQETLQIAIAAPLSNIEQVDALAGESIIQGAQLYVDQLNEAGGIDGKELELKVYDDQNNPKVAAKVAHEIIESDALAVIGHYSSNTTLVAGKIYQAYGIPVVTGSATADDITTWNNWYFRTVFKNSDQGLSIANYISKILERSRISVVYSTDSYGSTLADDTVNAFTELGGDVVNRWSLSTESDRDAIVDELVAMQENEADPGVIVVCA